MILGFTIETAYHGPTDTRGSRISATCKRDSDRTYRKFMSYRHELDSPENHLAAAELLMAAMEEELALPDSEPLRIVARGYGGRSDAGFHFIVNRGGA